MYKIELRSAALDEVKSMSGYQARDCFMYTFLISARMYGILRYYLSVDHNGQLETVRNAVYDLLADDEKLTELEERVNLMLVVRLSKERNDTLALALRPTLAG